AIDDLWRERVTGPGGTAFVARYGRPSNLLKLVRPFRQFPLARTEPASEDAALERAVARLTAALAPAAATWRAGAIVANRRLFGWDGVLSLNAKDGYPVANLNIATDAWQAYFDAGASEAPLPALAALFTIDTMERQRTEASIRAAKALPRHEVYDALT